uniref:Uncharacterized protein n=2 Tax=Triticum urartu TaxID=4572 RepID=A0A8R7JZA9_TRIUA
MMKQGTAAASGAFTGGGDVRAGAGERKISSLPAYLATAVEGCHITGDIVRRFAEMELSPLLRWLLGFRGSRERLLTDDLFIAKLAMEMGVSMIAKTAAEYEKRRENFVKEIDIVIADVVPLLSSATEDGQYVHMLIYNPDILNHMQMGIVEKTLCYCNAKCILYLNLIYFSLFTCCRHRPRRSCHRPP